MLWWEISHEYSDRTRREIVVLRHLEVQGRKYPEKVNSKEKYALRVVVRNYASHDGVLYKRMLNGTQLRCLKKDEADEVMREIHAGVCGSHMNGIILAKKIVRQGYYWMSMEKDCIQTVRQYHQY